MIMKRKARATRISNFLENKNSRLCANVYVNEMTSFLSHIYEHSRAENTATKVIPRYFLARGGGEIGNKSLMDIFRG